MRVIVAGGRDFKETTENLLWLLATLKNLGATTILCGCARGADELGAYASKRLGLMLERYPADWDRYGKRAGPIRNRQMACNADALIAFPGGLGTANMKLEAQSRNLKIIEYMETSLNKGNRV